MREVGEGLELRRLADQHREQVDQRADSLDGQTSQRSHRYDRKFSKQFLLFLLRYLDSI